MHSAWVQVKVLYALYASCIATPAKRGRIPNASIDVAERPCSSMWYAVNVAVAAVCSQWLRPATRVTLSSK